MSADAAQPAAEAVCRCCGAPDPTPIGSKIGGFRAHTFYFLRCCRCGIVSVDPVTDASIYDDAYYRGEGADPLVDYEREYRDYRSTPRLFEFEDLARIAERSLPGHDREAVRWLDYGCGAGGLLRYLSDRRVLRAGGRDLPIEATGFDVGSFAARLRNEGDLRVLDQRELANVPANSFDVVTCIEVIEHAEQPDEVMAQIARALRPGGVLLLTTGNMRCAAARLLGMRFPYLTPEIHITLFEPAALAQLYRRHGLEPMRVRYDGAIRFRIRKNLGKLDRWRTVRWLAQVRPARRMFDWLFGISAMPSARKPSPRPPAAGSGP